MGDETGSDLRGALHEFEYALPGQPAICKWLLVHGERICAIVAMPSDGVEAYELSVGSTNPSTFLSFVRGRLIPTVQPFPDKHSITTNVQFSMCRR